MPQRFLIIRLSSIGDIVHALPAVVALGEKYTDAEIDWAIEPRYARLLEGNRYVHRIIEVDTLGWRKNLLSRRVAAEIRQALGALRQASYDAVIDFQGLIKTAVIALLARSHQRIGFESKWLREPMAGLFYTRKVALLEREHAISENLALVGALGANPVSWRAPLPRTECTEREINKRLYEIGVNDFILISPGGGWVAKRWPPSSYAQLIECLGRETSWNVLLTGSEQEEETICGIVKQSGSRQAIYFPADLFHLIELERRAKLFIGGDSGPLHVAAALGVPIVSIYGPTDPKRNGPFDPDDIALSNSAPINHTRRGKNPSYIEGISVDSVMAAIRQRLARAYG